MNFTVPTIFSFLRHVLRGGIVVDLLSTVLHESRIPSSIPQNPQMEGPLKNLVVISPHSDTRPSIRAVPTDLPLTDGVAAAVILGGELWLSSNKHFVLSEARRVLAPDGVIVMLGADRKSASRPSCTDDKERSMSWWQPSGDEVEELLRRHFPYVYTYRSQLLRGSLLRRTPTSEFKSLTLTTFVSSPTTRAEHILHVATSKRRKLPTSLAICHEKPPSSIDTMYLSSPSIWLSSSHSKICSSPLCHTTFLHSPQEVDAPQTQSPIAPADTESNKKQLETLRRQLAQSEEKQRVLKEELESEKTSRHRADARLQQTEPALRAAELRVHQLENDLDLREIELARALSETTATKEELSRLTPNTAQFRGRAIQAEAELTRLRGMHERERTRSARLEEKLQNLDELLVEANRQITKIETSTQQAQEKALQGSQQQHQLELKILDLNEALARARAEAEDHQLHRVTAQRRADEYLEEVAAISEELEICRSELKSARSQARFERHKTEQSTAELARVQAQLKKETLLRSQSLPAELGNQLSTNLAASRILRSHVIRLASSAEELLRSANDAGPSREDED